MIDPPDRGTGQGIRRLIAEPVDRANLHRVARHHAPDDRAARDVFENRRNAFAETGRPVLTGQPAMVT